MLVKQQYMKHERLILNSTLMPRSQRRQYAKNYIKRLNFYENICAIKIVN